MNTPCSQSENDLIDLPSRELARLVWDPTQFLALRGILPGETRVLERAQNYSGRSHPALWAAFVLNGDGG